MTRELRILIRRDFMRPDRALVERLAQTPTGNVVDALGRCGALGPGTDPLLATPRFAGPALTVATAVRDNLAPYAVPACPRAMPGPRGSGRPERRFALVASWHYVARKSGPGPQGTRTRPGCVGHRTRSA
jgi:hypothetical protein